MKHIIYISILAIVLAGCTGHPSVPSSYTEAEGQPAIFPDYTDVTIPCNIAPMNFMMEDAEEVVARLKAGSKEYTYGQGNKVMIDADEWRELTSQGGDIEVETYAQRDGKWTKYKPFSMHLSADSIDRYVSYRLLPPTYVGFEQLAIRQRDITCWNECDIFNTRQITTEANGMCINCHTYQNYRTENMMFHMRIQHPGTMIVTGDKLSKVNIRKDGMISGAVYSSWHPTLRLITFTTGNTAQTFHTRDITKVEVMESKSDLYMYDVDNNSIIPISTEEKELELFPSWSPDGKWLYYSCCHYEETDTINDNINTALNHYKEFKYNLFRRSFDEKTFTFGEPELLYDAVTKQRSAVQPRISADGRYMVFAEGPNGLFHIWHPSAQIEILDLKTGELTDTKALNSPRAESYPSFSSTGRWILFESRRDDGNFTRTYISYFDRNGKAHKAFEVPQKDPEFFHLLTMSWSRPEFTIEPVKVTPQVFLQKALEEAKQAK